MKSKIGIIFIVTGAVLIALALSLTLYNIYTDKYAENYSSKVLEEIEEQLPESLHPFDRTNTVGNAYDLDNEMEIITVEGRDYIGIIKIPAINMELPVMSKWDYENLKLAPCRYKGSINEDSMIIIGHNYSGHFGKLKQLKENDDIYFIDAKGNAYNYKVSEMEILRGTDSEKMESGGWPLTLFTCTVSGTERVTVRCEWQSD